MTLTATTPAPAPDGVGHATGDATAVLPPVAPDPGDTTAVPVVGPDPGGAATVRPAPVPAEAARPELGCPEPARSEGVRAGTVRPESGRPVLDVVVPVYNERADLAPGVRRLHTYLSTQFPYPFRITIADNGSTDGTYGIACQLAAELPGVAAVCVPRKGRGHALHAVWSTSDAPVLAYMDVDMSTDLAALLPLAAPLISGHSDVAIGSRLTRGARVVRGARREIISRCYNLLLRGTLAARFSDAQCGFKAIRSEAAARLLPLVRDTGWFFDTELLVLAERSGLRIHEVPVDWVDDPDSRVDILATAMADLRGIARVGRALVGGDLPLTEIRRQLGRTPLSSTAPAAGRLAVGAPTVEAPTVELPTVESPVAGRSAAEPHAGMFRQLVRFGAIGIVSTLAYLLIYGLLRRYAGAQAANLAALAITAVANTAANRRMTFGIRGSGRAVRHHAQGMFVFVLGLVLTSGSLAVLSVLTDRPPRIVELIVLVLANLAATVLRFVLLRSWVFRPPSGSSRRAGG